MFLDENAYIYNKKMSIGIYKITSPSNKVYIGQSRNIEKRWKGYSVNKKKQKEQTKLFYSFRKYGIRNHKFEIIEKCKIPELNEKEIFWVEYYNSVKIGLNISKGGYYFWEVNIGKKHTKETKEKMREWWAKNKKPRSPKTISKIKETKRKNPRNTTPEMIEVFRQSSTSKKPILQYNLEGEFIKEYESINEAARQLKIRNDGISACLRKNQKTAYRSIWKYK